jgi:hypothetical protein
MILSIDEHADDAIIKKILEVPDITAVKLVKL